MPCGGAGGSKIDFPSFVFKISTATHSVNPNIGAKIKYVNILVFRDFGDNWFTLKTLFLSTEYRENN